MVRTFLALAAAALFVACASEPVATPRDADGAELRTPHDCVGEEGCTPGYWKNHTDNWPVVGPFSISPDDSFADIFGVPYDVTLLDALQGGGGSGEEGAEEILARAATAALLNAAHPGVDYPLVGFRTTEFGPGIIPSVQLVWGDRDAMLELATELDDFNNLGCTLN